MAANPSMSAEEYLAHQYHTDLRSPRELLEWEVEALVSKGVAKLEDADPFFKRGGELPKGLFLFIPPRPSPFDLDRLNRLMFLIVLGRSGGQNHLDPGLLEDVAEVPSGPYLMIDVKDGRERTNRDPLANAYDIATSNRSPYVVFEGIVHAICFPHTLIDHGLDLCGSRYKQGGEDMIPSLYANAGLSVDRQPLLWAASIRCGKALPNFGAPSCVSRMSA